MEERRKLNQEDLTLMRLPPELWRAVPDKVPASVRPVVLRYLKRAPEMLRKCAGLLLVGPTGVGKSSIAALIAREVRACSRSVLWVTVSDLRDSLRARQMFDDDVSVMGRARGVDLLLLDDLRESDAGERFLNPVELEQLVLQRGSWSRTTIITTRMNSTQIFKLFGTFLQATKAHLVSVSVEGDNQRLDLGNKLTADVLGTKGDQ